MDDVAKNLFGPVLPPPGDRDELIGAAGELGADVVDDQVEIAVFPTTRASTSRGTGSLAEKMTASTRPIHSRQRSSYGRCSSSVSSSAG